MFALLLLPASSVCSTDPTPVLNPAMPQILQQVSAQMPADWHPLQMRNGDVHLHNPLQRLNARINRHGIRLQVQDGFGLKMQLVRFGFNGCLKTPQAGRVDINGVRVDVMHAAGLDEWFINTPIGIEQGFTLMTASNAPHKGPDTSGSHRFELHFELSGDLLPELTARGLAFKDSAGKVRMHYHQLLAFDARQQILPARLALAGNHLSITVDTRGAVYPLTIDPLFSSEQDLSASDAAAEDQFGDAVAVDGDTIVIGAPLVNLGTSDDAGAAYVFVRDPSTGVFTEQQKIEASDAAAEDNFGSAVDVDGHSIAVGAPLVNAGTSFDTGAIYVFTRDPTDPTD
ncbi:MAG: FG-GAP repeat protein, partial [Desulfobacterales bacterium]|nr:FG-GAP repeat protein [Desulfobacterales bacterium]